MTVAVVLEMDACVGRDQHFLGISTYALLLFQCYTYVDITKQQYSECIVRD